IRKTLISYAIWEIRSRTRTYEKPGFRRESCERPK
ncbi:hypothetical protein MUK42_32963, partial [Musa troglodytarum]